MKNITSNKIIKNCQINLGFTQGVEQYDNKGNLYKEISKNNVYSENDPNTIYDYSVSLNIFLKIVNKLKVHDAWIKSKLNTLPIGIQLNIKNLLKNPVFRKQYNLNDDIFE